MKLINFWSWIWLLLLMLLLFSLTFQSAQQCSMCDSWALALFEVMHRTAYTKSVAVHV